MPMGNYTVAFLDILGFKRSIDNVPLEDLAHRYEYLVGQIGNWLNEASVKGVDINWIPLFPDPLRINKLCTRYFFSDSIILFSEDNTSKSCLNLLTYAWKFHQVLLGAGVPIRGGITHGEMYINKEQQIFLGKALTDAYLLEKNQQWIGVAIDKSVFTAFPDLDNLLKANDLLNSVFFEYDVPLKDGITQKMRTLNWRYNLKVEHGTRSLFPPTHDERVLEKQNNALKYDSAVVSAKKHCSQDRDQLPSMFRIYEVRNSKPLENGDDL